MGFHIKRKHLKSILHFCVGKPRRWCLLVIFALLIGLYSVQQPTGFDREYPGERIFSGFSVSGQLARLRSRNYSRFENGNIGLIKRVSPTNIELHLRSDNDDALPAFWRQWFRAQLENIDTQKTTRLTIKGAGQWGYYLPVYSYDGEHWQQFKEAEVLEVNRSEILMQKRFQKASLQIARYFPYSYSDLQKYLRHLARDPLVRIDTLGETPEKRAMPFISLGEPVDASERAMKIGRVFLHARTHPGEVGSSFLLEGFIDYLRGKSQVAQRLRRLLVFDIIPMVNIDGIVAGNHRVTPGGINLEGKWYPAGEGMALDSQRVPTEVQRIHAKIVQRLADGIAPLMAFNLHSSGGEPRDQMFFFPHFGSVQNGYTHTESELWRKQMIFIQGLQDLRGPAWFNPPPEDGGRAFLNQNVPESWWWRHYQDRVMALSIESTYGRLPKGQGWVQPADMRRMGAYLARAIDMYLSKINKLNPTHADNAQVFSTPIR